ncbi:MAG: iron ABC transporter substrate-binding protein [Caldilineales bacterium]|nr:iron ABC transporter substrate-binding protein [Caldilineales bacterium]MDW8318175.1 iron ABC transporter substrate-binding protein [Anaerolineae bacterium]
MLPQLPRVSVLLLLSAALSVLVGCTTLQPAPSNPTAAAATPVEQPSPTAAAQPQQLTVYSGRNENLIGPLVEQFRQETGIEVSVRYGDTAEMAATILEEGKNSPADVFFAQDAGALGALAAKGRLQPLPAEILQQVDARFRDPNGRWVGASGRARVVVYNTDRVTEADLPDSIFGFTDPAWRGRVGWAPTNGSFQAMVTAMRLLHGEDAARAWLQGMIANDVKVYPNNSAIVEAVGKGEVDVGLVNHYYLYRFLAERGESFPARNYFTRAVDAGALTNIAGLGIVDTARNRDAAERFVAYMLSTAAQKYFAEKTYEYPLVAGVAADSRLRPLTELQTPNLDLSRLEDLEGTLRLLQEVGALQ